MRQKGFTPILVLLIVVLLVVLGYFAFTKGYVSVNLPKPSASVIPSAIPNPSPTKDPKLNWKTYTQSVFSVKYPATMEITENISNKNQAPQIEFYGAGGTITIIWGKANGSNADYIVPTDDPNATSISTQEFVNLRRQMYQEPRSGFTLGASEQTSIDGQKAVYYMVTSDVYGTSPEYVVSDKGILYLILTETGDSSFNQTLNQILSTFKFTQ